MQLFIKQFEELSLDELYDILAARAEVFVVEQDCVYQDMDDKDQPSYHLFLKDNDDVVAVSRIIPEGISYDEMSIGRVVVKKTHRGQGISKIMMKLHSKHGLILISCMMVLSYSLKIQLLMLFLAHRIH